ncbi:adenosylmethionine--8-amino-7-oxononanoate transaminase [Burkholderia sp. AU19243]|uniref:Adenosylmethionine-8-amino-7-oxononanoate aminotransferase n=1 Tax=Burkholderia latens TaxID=488446 RepID=A0AAP1C7R7_9BURK|nr:MULTISPECIES: adenosylmethionine--8-amino-7-oxononanoate transaminase [Burkholderia]MBR8143402.1 adenosylmethionine--8-amino-7-oxononanoate transaminase [Burkholderia vietnamiensis]AOK05517.1 adenosylmethionine-8-amino-7-oxononanoate aminotransferase [Burkholderia latens]KVA11094.1 adenosylmethionine-8-amino-7-oxononanoate aminotransferase [Burkholderia latens]MBR8363212.1 adenosylmethionine--8-amino-7-oxononanoate transaminase [Burkholderia sp. AU19243]MBY4695834.1 adenosylmethionine--8-am
MSTPATDDWVARSLRAVWHPCTQMKHHERLPLIPVARGAGVWLYDRDGRRYFDAISSWWVNLFGHANPDINAALKNQLDTLEHAMLAGCTHEPAIELAERLHALTGRTLGHAFFASDGASAVEIALKMSFHAWRNRGRADKREFVCVANGYHGETIGALGVTDVALFKDAYDPLIRNAHVVASPDARGALPGETAADAAGRALADVRRLFAERADRIAALIVEPLVQCAAGMAMHDPSYVRGLRALCDEFGVHLIADEIAVGCGRTGTFFACEQAGVWPDFLCLSKGISGGYLPLSLVLTRDDVFASFYDDDTTRGFLHSHSYTGNPLACRAAVATLDLFARDDVLAANARKSDAMRAALAPLAAHPQVRHLRERGTLFAFDLALDGDAARGFSRRFFERALERELLLRPIGTTVYLMPPYVMNDDDIAWLAQRTRDTLDATLAEAA